MGRRINWPGGHEFAFTVVDDTDGATVANIKPVYDYLIEHRILTTKTCWVYPPRDTVYKGESLQDNDYLEFMRDIQRRGVEIGFHNAGSGEFTREETLAALEEFKEKLGAYPTLHINHSNNVENLYWGKERFSGPVRWLYSLKKNHVLSCGSDPASEYFWGDFSKTHFKYIRNRTFNGLNTLKEDPRLVYQEVEKQEYSNYWFSSSDGMRLVPFLKLLSKERVDKLVKEHGCAIVYTHFAYDFVDKKGILNEGFKRAIDYLASKNGWFVPASQLLDYILENKEYEPSKSYEARMDIRWLIERIKKSDR